MSAKKDWIWMPHPAHLIVSQHCQFHLATVVGDYIVSTVGEYWPERSVREIHAKIHDEAWHQQNNHLKGDAYDAAYAQRFGFEEIGVQRLYETMVFRAKKSPKDGGCQACEYVMESGENLDFNGYNHPKDAREGHMEMCQKWSRRREKK